MGSLILVVITDINSADLKGLMTDISKEDVELFRLAKETSEKVPMKIFTFMFDILLMEFSKFKLQMF